LGNALIFKNIFIEIKSSPSSNYLYLGISAFTTTLSWIFYYRAMKDGPVSFVASIDKASILITILLSYVFLKEPFSPKLFIGAGFIFLGLVVLIWK
jgi:bacterial/archaeal transporter family protein